MSIKLHPMYSETALRFLRPGFLGLVSGLALERFLVLGPLALLSALGLCGCGGCGKSDSMAPGSLEALSPTQAAKIVQAVIDDSITNKPGNHSPLYPVEDVTQNPRPWKVHIDLSSNMQGYVNAQNSGLQGLLEHLHKFMPAGSVFQGERSDMPAAENRIAQLLKPETYTGTGVNYSNLFMRLVSEREYNHLFLTDCVLLNNRRLLPPRCIADELKFYLARGGDFSLFVFRMAFRGDYTSAWNITHLPENAPPEDAVVKNLLTEARPIMLWVFMPPGQSIGTQASPTGKLAELLNLKQTTSLSGESSFGNWQCLFPPSRGKQQFQLLANSLSPNCQSNIIHAQGFNAMPWVKFANISQGVPFSFNVLVPVTSVERTNLTPAALLDAVRTSTEVNVDCWGITNLQSGNVARLARENPEVTWMNVLAASTNQVAEDCLLNIRLKRPALPGANITPDKMVLMFTVRPIRSDAAGLWRDLAGLSTDNDSGPSTADRIYGLGDVLGLVQTECGVYARTLVFAEWGR